MTVVVPLVPSALEYAGVLHGIVVVAPSAVVIFSESLQVNWIFAPAEATVDQ